MPRYQILDGETVVNTIVADESFVSAHYSGAYRLVDNLPDPVSTPAVPLEVEGWKAEVTMKSTMSADGTTSVWDATQAAITAMTDGPDKLAAQAVLARGDMRRDSPLLAAVATQIGLTSAQIDDMFVRAAALSA